MFTYQYYDLPAVGATLFTAVLLPNAVGQFPVMLMRTPYVDALQTVEKEDICLRYLSEFASWLHRGYAVIVQHCRGRGKSSGDFVPYIYEREDGLALQAWVRRQPFYDGSLYLRGGSYLASVHYATAPFADDIKGAVFSVQDCERYNIAYRNGCLKIGLHGNWYVQNYKSDRIRKNFVPASFDMLPLSDFSEAVLGEPSEDFDEMIRHPDPQDAFWQTRYGGADARNAVKDVKFPVLLTTGFYDIYTGGVFDMWQNMTDAARKQSALVVHPYDHGGNPGQMTYPNGKISEAFGSDYELDWLDFCRGVRKEAPFVQGVVTYYRSFENVWQTDDFAYGKLQKEFVLGNRRIEYVYNPYAAPTFRGGLSANFGGSQIQEKPNSRYDVVSVYTETFDEDMFVKGKMKVKLRVTSDCEDTCFYVRISIPRDQGDLGLRDDITTLCYQLGDYTPNTDVDLQFVFDEHAFLVRKGERLRVDIASANRECYVRHTNQKGLYSEQRTARIAHNTVDLTSSSLILPVEV